MNKIAVVIPSYKSKLSTNETISLEQCRKIFKLYDIYFLLPNGVDAVYSDDEKKVYVDEIHLSSRKKYSDYVLSEEFYNLFSDYDYILIYQLDAFVFEDKLDYFCSLEYDYIGAEWLYGLECHANNQSLWYFGNGGFSLRKVSSFLKWIRNNRNIVEYGKMLLPEDLVIAIYGKDDLSIAGREVAMDFAYDMHPEECYIMNDNKLPFGCHAWDRFDNAFWKRIIDTYGYNVELKNVDDEETMLLCTGKERSEKMKRFFDKNKLDHCLKQVISEYKGELYVFGAGQYGFSFINMVKNTEITIRGIIDNDIEKQGKFIENNIIYSFEEYLRDNNFPILIALANPKPIIKQFNKAGLVQNINYATSHDLQLKMCGE